MDFAKQEEWVQECARLLQDWAQNEEMIDSHYTAHGKLCNEAARLLRTVPTASSEEQCSHDWRIWPETDGQEQRCSKCHTYRQTLREEIAAKVEQMASHYDTGGMVYSTLHSAAHLLRTLQPAISEGKREAVARRLEQDAAMNLEMPATSHLQKTGYLELEAARLLRAPQQQKETTE